MLGAVQLTSLVGAFRQTQGVPKLPATQMNTGSSSPLFSSHLSGVHGSTNPV